MDIKERELKLLFIIQAIMATVIFLLYGVRETTDSLSLYIALDSFYTNPVSDESTVVFSRFLRPLSLWLAYPISFLGDANSFAVQSFIFQLSTIYFFYYFTLELFGDNRLSFYSVILYIFSPITIRHTFLVMTDISTWFLFIFSLYYILLQVRLSEWRLNRVITLSLLCGFFTLMKENAGSGIIFLGLSILFSSNKRVTFQAKIKLLGFSFISFLTPIFLNNLIVLYYYDFTILDWINHEVGTYKHSLIQFVASFKNAFGILVPFALYYFFTMDYSKNYEVLFILIASLFLFLIFGSQVGRLLFISFPIFIPVSLLGLKKLTKSFFKMDFNSKYFPMFVLFAVVINHILFKDNLEYIFKLI